MSMLVTVVPFRGVPEPSVAVLDTCVLDVVESGGRSGLPAVFVFCYYAGGVVLAKDSLC